jgi:two-component system, NarL family, response regulator LiaR
MVNVVVIEDHPLMRVAIIAALSDAGGFDVTGSCADGAAAVPLVLRLRPDVVVMDLRLHGADGIEATRRIIAAWPHARIVVYTAAPMSHDVAAAFDAGAAAVVSKSTQVEELLREVRAAARLS